MGSDSTRPSSLSVVDDAPARPSFFARLAAPLRSRSRNLADFHIRLKEPHRQYVAGDHVRGYVVLSVIKAFRITHLTVALHGHVRAFKSAGAAAQHVPIDPGTFSADDSSHYRYHGNGHASLFKDEQVLCGEGRLQPARFEFEFDLLFPEKGLPSSIDFERGSISYILTAMITRPTAITPTTSCETKVSFTEQVDVGLFSAPTERRVVMQTMRRKPRRRRTTTSAAAPAVKISPAVLEAPEAASEGDSTRANENSYSSHNSAVEDAGILSQSLGSHHRTPLHSDIQSEFSGESIISNNSSSGRNGEASGESNAGSKMSGIEGREITATIEVMKGGSIPGDVVPVRIRVNHNRKLKSMHGIIVTLYRQGRVDYAPPIHMFADLSKEDSARLERDEYYPKSKTGLGGLSLSSAGSCSVFRKDLYQTVNPLIVDPTTLTATINTSVRVPEDVFPSIKGVPGGLISFRYYVEVVVDLGGRLAGSASAVTQQSSRLGAGGIHSSGIASSLSTFDNNNTGWAGSIVDTDHLRREKGVISVASEITVGTTDSSRLKKNKGVARPSLAFQRPSSRDGDQFGPEDNGYIWHDNQPPAPDLSRTYSKDHQASSHAYDQPPPLSRHAPQPYTPAATSQDVQHHEPEPRTPLYIPRPEIPEQQGLSEKEIARQAEQRLLPSQPVSLPEGSQAGPSQPSAPPVEDAEAATEAVVPSYLDVPQTSTAGRITPDISVTVEDGPSAPSFADLSAASPLSPNEDKQELERRRLLEEASAPPEIPEEYAASVAGPSAPPMHDAAAAAATAPDEYGMAAGIVAGPSAPPAAMLSPYDEQQQLLPSDDGDNHYEARDPMNMIAGPSTSAATTSEPLPRYER